MKPFDHMQHITNRTPTQAFIDGAFADHAERAVQRAEDDEHAEPEPEHMPEHWAYSFWVQKRIRADLYERCDEFGIGRDQITALLDAVLGDLPEEMEG